jgi:hypothetical protein
LYLREFNQARTAQAQAIRDSGGQLHIRGRIWFKGRVRDHGKIEEFDEDHAAPIKDLSERSPCSPHNAHFTYAMQDIDNISAQLGIPWELEKDVPFASSFTFIGLTWNLITRSVSLSVSKKQRYTEAIRAWHSTHTHTLNEAEKLHGKLLHASLVITKGRPFLVNIEAFLGVFHDAPFKPCTPPRHLQEDLHWWAAALTPKCTKATPHDHHHGRPTVFTSWLQPSQSYSQKENISGSSETTWASTRDGGKGGVATDPPMKSSSWLTSSVTNQTAFSTRSMFPLSSTPQMAPQEESTVLQPYSCPPLPYHPQCSTLEWI